MGRTVVRQNSNQSTEPNQKYVRRSASTVLGNSTTTTIAPASEYQDATSITSEETAKPGALVRSNTDAGPRRQSFPEKPDVAEDWEIRHGYDKQYNSSKYLEHLSSVSDART